MAVTEPLACAELVALVTDYLEGALSLADRARFDAHLAECPGCVTYVEQFRQTLTAIGTLREEDVTPAARDALLAAFRDWKHAPGGGTTDPPAG
ncbi:MAG: zf-HC2 domain-containing protein [Actinomycetota bacterium]